MLPLPLLGVAFLFTADAFLFEDPREISNTVEPFYSFKSAKNVIFTNLASTDIPIVWNHDGMDLTHVPAALLWRHCFVRHPIDRKIDGLSFAEADKRVSLWNRQFAWVDPITSEEVVKSIGRGFYSYANFSDISQKWRETFQIETGIDPLTLDVHDYTSPLLNVSLSLLVRHCVDTSLPFYHLWSLMDEADVIFIDAVSNQTIVDRIASSCPPPSEPRACLIYLRIGLLKGANAQVGMVQVIRFAMAARRQKYVFVSAWPEIWCVPYSMYPTEWPKRRRQVVKPEMAMEIRNVLESQELIAWFGTNICGDHPKLRLLPLGAKTTPDGLVTKSRLLNTPLWIALNGHNSRSLFHLHPRRSLLSALLIHRGNNDSPANSNLAGLRRGMVSHMETAFSPEDFSNLTLSEEYLNRVKVVTANRRNAPPLKYDGITFYLDIKNSRFTVCPTGAATDSHCMWESLTLGSIPIIHETPVSSICDNLPCLVLRNNSLSDLTPSYLRHMDHVMRRRRDYEWNKLYGVHWIKGVREATYL